MAKRNRRSEAIRLLERALALAPRCLAAFEAFAQDLGQRDHVGLQGLLARIGEKLADQARRPIGVLADLHHVGEGLVAGPVAQQQQVAEADHGGQQIVEVVCDAAGELADRLKA